jgi:membrane-bound lytic murein transglycosylase A
MSDILVPTSFLHLSGWNTNDLATPLQAFQRSAQEMLSSASGFRRVAAFGGTLEDWTAACEASLLARDARHFFETYFLPFHVRDPERPEGLFTGYYEPELEGARTAQADYPVPVYARPRDLASFTPEETQATGLAYGRHIEGKPAAYDTRRDIENGSLHGRAEVICWVRDWVDAFFMHVQGQGRVRFADGTTLRLSYAAKSGHSYTGIGRILVDKGVAPIEKMSMQVLRDWMRDNPAAARELMWNNKSYIFFQGVNIQDPALGGIGAAKVPLTPVCSLAVDRAHWMFGTPLWVNTTYPPEVAKTDARVCRLMIAQDTGSAIRGVVRGDFYWGWGQEAESIAGHMKSPGDMVALLPVALARRLGHST